MSPKTKFELRSLLGEMLSLAVSGPMLLFAFFLFKIYKWTRLGPEMFQQKVLQVKGTGYEMLQIAWHAELWPLVKMIPVVIVLDVLIRQILREIRR